MIWAALPLERLATDLQPGFASQPSSGDDGVAQLRTNNVSPEGRIDLSEVKRVPASRAQTERYHLERGDILFNNTNSPALVGKTAYFDEAGTYLFSNHMTRIRVDRRIAEPRFVARFLHWSWSQGALRGLVTQWVNQAAINRAQLASVAVPLPPVSEQRRIVEILDQADRLRRLRAEADAKADRILGALFIRSFGDPASNPKELPRKTLSELAGLGPQYGANAAAAPLSDGLPRYVRITDIDEHGRLRPTGAVTIDATDWAQYHLEPGDLLFARSGATVGKTYVHSSDDGSCVFAGYLIRFRFRADQIHPLVVFAFTRTKAYDNWVRSKRRTAAQPNINGQEYATLEVLVPDRSEQHRFVSMIEQLRAISRMRARAHEQIDTLNTALLDRAFSGDLTAAWREAHMHDLLQEVRHQASVSAASFASDL